MFRIFFLTIGVFWCELEFVMCGDGLEFWVRDPKYEPRRVMADNPHRAFRNNKFTANKTEKEVPRRLNTTSTAKFKEVTTVTTAVLRNASAKGLQVKAGPKTFRSNNFTKKIDAQLKKKESLRSGITKQTWARFRNKKQSGETEQSIRSTRMTPLYLMQNSEEHGKTPAPQKKKTATNEDQFLSPYSVGNQLHKFANNFPDVNITFEVIGRTADYNDLILMKASEERNSDRYFRADNSKYIDEVPEKKIVFIVHGLSVKGIKKLPCLYNVEELKTLLEYYYEHLDKFDIFVIPLANPDGLVVSSSVWNKNASPQSACVGVALDRNFDVAWDPAASTSSCSQQYPGPAAFSEAETKAVRDVLHRYSHKIIAYIHVHAGSYDPSIFKGEAVLYPKGFTDSQSDDDKYMDLKGEIDEAMRNASFQVMSVAVETLHSWYGKVTGTSVDYASVIYGIPYALEFAMQLYESYNDGDIDAKLANSDANLPNNALTAIWKRIIDVVFTNMWRSSNNGDV